MAAIKCSACEANPSITFCNETGVPLCGDCAIACDRCSVSIVRTKAQVTSKGRKLCPKCMAERNAKRQARREQMKEKRRRADEMEDGPGGIEAPVASRPVAAAPISPYVPSKRPSAPAASPLSFEALNDSTGVQAPPAKAESDDLGSDAGADDETPKKDGRGKRNFGLEGVPTDTSSRLELPPIDENRPLLVQSGHQAPSKTAYFFAFFFFGIAGLVFYSTTPILKDVLFPFDTPAYEFKSGMDTPIMDTNRLRNTSNINQFEILSQAPTFFVGWLIVVVYLGGTTLIIVSTVRSAISSYRTKRNLKKSQKKNPNDPFSSLSGH